MYNQYYNPYAAGGSGLSLFSRIRGINWGSFLNNTQKTLNVINQAIPIVNQVKPIVNNARTMFRVMKEVNTPDTIPSNNSTTSKGETTSNTSTEIKKEVTNKPQFFI